MSSTQASLGRSTSFASTGVADRPQGTWSRIRRPERAAAIAASQQEVFGVNRKSALDLL